MEDGRRLTDDEARRFEDVVRSFTDRPCYQRAPEVEARILAACDEVRARRRPWSLRRRRRRA
jgi:hypothetical protein